MNAPRPPACRAAREAGGERWREHLATCSACREEVVEAWLRRAPTPPEPDPADLRRRLAAVEAERATRRRWLTWLSGAGAAGLVGAAAAWLWSVRRRPWEEELELIAALDLLEEFSDEADWELLAELDDVAVLAELESDPTAGEEER